MTLTYLPFSPGRIVVTAAACRALDRLSPGGAESAVAALLRRHLAHDWGEVQPDEAADNERFVWQPCPDGRILSIYSVGAGVDHVTIHVATEPDRSLTTVMLAEEY